MKLLESPRKECILNNDEMISILGGENFSCPKTYKDGGLFGGDFCSENYMKVAIATVLIIIVAIIILAHLNMDKVSNTSGAAVGLRNVIM